MFDNIYCDFMDVFGLELMSGELGCVTNYTLSNNKFNFSILKKKLIV